MLNLVQVQERLRDVPMQALMQYANGSNPQIPPFLALGELNRRKRMQESAAADQAQEMEGAPTVKEQIEQATGLLSLQGSRQKQAARQQAGAQAAMPMAAPNTTTSEPAQLAAGGFLDDIVVPRDFQAGGQAMNPEMLKRLIMMKAMQQKRPQGIASVPMNAFKRSDYAGGGIVAFQTGGMPDTSETMRKKAEQYRQMLRTLFGKPGEQVDPADTKELFKESVTEMSDNYPDESRRGSGSFATERDKQGNLVRPDFTKPFYPGDRPSTEKVKVEEEVVKPSVGGGRSGIAALTTNRFNLPKTDDLTDEQRLTSLRNLQRMAGVKENPFAEVEERYKNIEAADLERRKGQPMDQFIEFLSGVAAGPRGGTFGTQGAAGVKAASKLRAEQEASNRKQDMDMAALRTSFAKEQDARARGDAEAVRKEKEAQEKLKIDLAKLQSEDEYRQRYLDIQQEQVGVQRERVMADKSQADRTRQMAEINEFISNFRSKNANNPKYINNPGLLEQDAIAAAMRFFGPQRFKDLGLAPGMESGTSAPSGPRPPLSSFQK